MTPKHPEMSNHLPGCLVIAHPVTGICCPVPRRHTRRFGTVGGLHGFHQLRTVSVGLKSQKKRRHSVWMFYGVLMALKVYAGYAVYAAGTVI